MNFVVLLLAGALLCNCLPHLASGLQGAPFPTPFAKPRGVGLSPPLVNFFWGSFNLFVGCAILVCSPLPLAPSLGLLAFLVGFLALGTYLALHFGKVRRP
jgi:hypothetical protein